MDADFAVTKAVDTANETDTCSTRVAQILDYISFIHYFQIVNMFCLVAVYSDSIFK